MKYLAQLLLLLACGLISCGSPSQLDIDQYATWISHPDNPYRTIRQLGEFRLEAQFVSPELSALRHFRGQIDAEKLQLVKEDQANLWLFELEIGLQKPSQALLKYQLKDPGEYQDRIQFLITEARKHCFLLHEGDTISPLHVQFEQAYDLADHIRLQMAFGPPVRPASNIVLVYDERLFSLGPVRFPFDTESLFHPPVLKL